MGASRFRCLVGGFFALGSRSFVVFGGALGVSGLRSARGSCGFGGRGAFTDLRIMGGVVNVGVFRVGLCWDLLGCVWGCWDPPLLGYDGMRWGYWDFGCFCYVLRFVGDIGFSL